MIETYVQDHHKTKKLLAVRSFKPDLLLSNKKIRLQYDEVFFRHQCVLKSLIQQQTRVNDSTTDPSFTL